MIGNTHVSNTSGRIELLGTATSSAAGSYTFNVKNVCDDYADLTIDDFLIVPQQICLNVSSVDSSVSSAVATRLSYSYSASTGKITIKLGSNNASGISLGYSNANYCNSSKIYRKY